MTTESDTLCMQTAREYADSLENWYNTVTAPDFDEDEYRENGGFDPLDDPLDILFTVNARKSYRGCEITLACGGPNVYLNTRNREVEVYWGGKKAVAVVPYVICDYIDDYMEDYARSIGMCE